jgi:uncharacterized protein
VPTTDEDRVHESLDEEECARLLATTAIGRLGFTDGALPAIVPVSFTLHEGHVLIAARQGSPVVNAVRGSVVAFEVDAYDPAVRTGWSVTVVGPSRVISDPEQVASLAGLPVSARPPDSSRCYISVKLGLIRGWRMAPSPGDAEPAARDGSPEAQV